MPPIVHELEESDFVVWHQKEDLVHAVIEQGDARVRVPDQVLVAVQV